MEDATIDLITTPRAGAEIECNPRVYIPFSRFSDGWDRGTSQGKTWPERNLLDACTCVQPDQQGSESSFFSDGAGHQ